MAQVINTNVMSLNAQRNTIQNSASMATTLQRLSSGLRINSAKDDAAGLAISDRMTSQIRGLNQAVRNANDAISMVQTVEGALTEVTGMLQRMRELAVQSVNGTNSSADRVALDTEFDQLATEIARISDKTTWNGMTVAASATTYTFQVGADSADTVSIDFKDVNSSLNGMSDVSGGSVSTAATAASSITHVDNAISAVDAYRSSLGAMVNRLTYAADNLTNVANNTAASRSRIVDTDYAATTTELARTQIIQQAATAMLAQANQSPSSVLSLLQ